LRFSEYGSSTPITAGVSYSWKDSTAVDTHLSLTDGVVTLTEGLTANTSAEISCQLSGQEKDVIQILAFKSDTPIPAYNSVDDAGYIQSKNSSSKLFITVKGHNYIMSGANLNELCFVSASGNDQQNNLEISTGTLNTTDNTVTYTVSIKPTASTTDIVGNFALKLAPTNASIST
jgi:hypothetical protein